MQDLREPELVLWRQDLKLLGKARTDAETARKAAESRGRGSHESLPTEDTYCQPAMQVDAGLTLSPFLAVTDN